ncbi:phosphotransferase family protein [Mycolicibacterium thermoresistibile]
MSTTTAASPTLVSRISERFAQDLNLQVSDVTPIVGGHSGLTYRVTTNGPAFVVKAVPEHQRPIGRHDMMRQARILRALADTPTPVPGVAIIDETAPAWFAMDLVAGESLEPVLDDPPVPPQRAARRMRAAAGLLRTLHAVPVEKIPADAPPLSPEDELARWARTMGAVPADLVPGADDLQRRLSQDVPTGMPVTLVHGDFRLGNIIADGDELAALIDWEIWSLGDPRVELGWFLVFADGTNFPGAGRVVPGLPDADELRSLYTENPLPDVEWFDALGRFKMAAIMGHNLRRHREGRHHDPEQEKLPATIRSLIDNALRLLG